MAFTANSKYREPAKDSFVKIYSIDTVVDDDGDVTATKNYPYSSSMKYGIKAYVMANKASENITQSLVSEVLTLSVYINYREGISPEMYLDFRGRTFRILAADPYDFSGKELKLTCSLTAEPSYQEEKYNDQH